MAARYIEIAAELRGRIDRGVYPEGSTLPRQTDLAEEFGVNVNTVAAAVRELASDSVVQPRRQQGTLVLPRPDLRRLGVNRYARSNWRSDKVAFAVDREASGAAWSRTDQTQTVDVIQASPELAEAFEIKIGAPVVQRARLVRDAEKKPTHTLTSYYRYRDVKGSLLLSDIPGPAGKGGGFQVLTDLGMEPHHISENLRARNASEVDVVQLELARGEPVVLLERRTYTAAGRLIEVARGVHVASRFEWTYEFDVPE